MAESESPWYRSFFGADCLGVYGYLMTPERAEREASFAEQALGIERGQAVLDLCCGHGRHALPLAAHGLQVTGLDLSRSYLDLAEAAAHDQGLEVDFVHADMREIPFEDHFDAVINMSSSFGYLESEAEDAKVMAAIARALKPGGRLLMDLINREWVIANYAPHDWHHGDDGVLYLEQREIDLVNSRNHVSFVAIEPDGSRRDVVGHHFRLYTLTEVLRHFEAVGLTFETAYGSFDGEPYGLVTRRMIVVAAKPA